MNFAKLSFLFMLVLSIAACGDDDEDAMACMQADWVGTYTGTEVCDGDAADATVTITASGTDAIVIEVTDPGFGSVTYDPIVPVGCNINASGVDQGVTLSLVANLNDDVVVITSTVTVGTESDICIATATRD